MECSICLEIYRNPRILFCGHTFCEKCILAITKGKKIECPECRFCFTIDDKEIPKNIALMHLIEEHQQLLNRGQPNINNIHSSSYCKG